MSLRQVFTDCGSIYNIQLIVKRLSSYCVIYLCCVFMDSGLVGMSNATITDHKPIQSTTRKEERHDNNSHMTARAPSRVKHPDTRARGLELERSQSTASHNKDHTPIQNHTNQGLNKFCWQNSCHRSRC